ncbi:A/G-specific adenine glycosylase [Roseovarius indicus]|uniref:Adenine DNA glycosylase n=1 Tax=Roseovarius indicus TaxID=540747 RepID=A0A0T5P6U4_9RHOB|nr:A/G-specific adenine glycosylase [Roseovarius indicus]KRS16790.1 adenine glycosylase [Roseovarius indicus]QEW24313.1 A/G-specific adenine glycosylase [Roseovarius indicus]SFD72700.1 A/G-specific DNA-adenine glycosylase [Roseovarius indicus]
MRDRQVQDILDWYDRHARDLPWRVGPSARAAGVRPDPYRVWLSEVMLQQTTVAAVKAYFERFTTLWPTVTDLARAEDGMVMGEWAGLGYYARARNLLKCARVVADEHGGRFPETREGLQALPGIGPYTAAAISAIAFDEPEVVVDGNVERVMARLFDIRTPMPAAKPEMKAAAAEMTPNHRPGCYAQAVMDLGATICTPRSPACGICPWREPCLARTAGIQAELPVKAPKKTKPTRYGYAYVARRADGAWLLERRPDSGLLGGMLGWPGSDWNEDPRAAPPIKADWHRLTEEARHTFTHFHLRLKIDVANLPPDAEPEHGTFIPRHEFRPASLPTVMRKVFDLAHGSFENVG